MPQVVRVGKYVVVIYTNDHAPAHVHVRFGKSSVRILITATSVTLDTTDGKPKRQEILRALTIVAANLDACLAKWKEFHG